MKTGSAKECAQMYLMIIQYCDFQEMKSDTFNVSQEAFQSISFKITFIADAVKLVIRGHWLTQTPTQPFTKSYEPIDFCPFTPSYMDKLVMHG